jgi:Protein of unknown function (DUF2934)
MHHVSDAVSLNMHKERTNVPAKKTTRSTSTARRSTTPTAAAKPPRARRAKPVRSAATPAVALETTAVRQPAPKASTPRPVTREDIAVRAYFLALENAGKGGSLDYWLRAERELLQGASRD